MSNVRPTGDAIRHRAFLTVLLAFVLDVMDSTIVTVAIPDIQLDMHLTNSAMQWTVAGYFLCFAVLLIAGGRLGDMYGHRRMFLIGVTGFTLASAGCGLADTAERLIAARIFQGGAGALMAPQVMALVQILYSPAERIGRLAFFGILGGAAAIAGPIVGGFLIKANLFDLGWRAIFLVNLPLGIIGIASGLRYLPRESGTKEDRLDVGGILLLAAVLLLVLYPMIDGRDRGWPAWSIGLMAMALPVFIFFLLQQQRRQRSTADALLAPDLFRDRSFALGLLATLFFSTATGGFFMPLMLTLQKGLGFSAFQAALLHIPFAGGVMIGIAALGRKLVPMYGKYVLIGGAVLMALAVMVLFWFLGTDRVHVIAMMVSLAAAGVGMGMVTGPMAPLVLARVNTVYAGMASGAFKTTQQIGGAVGAALVGALFFTTAERAGSMIPGMGAALLGVVCALACAVLCAALMPSMPFGYETGHETVPAELGRE